LGAKRYSFVHRAEVKGVVAKIEQELGERAREHGLVVTREGADGSLLCRPGVEVHVIVLPGIVHVDVDLGWLLEIIRSRVDRELGQRVPAFLRCCEALSSTHGRCA
jgi:hypothetical protein